MANFNAMSDEDLLSLFSDWYKDVNGIRPRGAYWDRDHMLEWMEHETKPEVQEERRAQWEEESRWIQEQEDRFQEQEARFRQDLEELYQENQEQIFYEMEVALGA